MSGSFPKVNTLATGKNKKGLLFNCYMVMDSTNNGEKPTYLCYTMGHTFQFEGNVLFNDALNTFFLSGIIVILSSVSDNRLHSDIIVIVMFITVSILIL